MRTPIGTILIGLLISVATLNAEPRQNAVIAPYASNLVVLSGDDLVPYDAKEFLHAPYTVLFFGAGWCSDTRRFSPALVKAYDRQRQGAKQFEVLLVSHDKSADGMLKFMRLQKMKWPALAFNQKAAAEDLEHFYSGKGIPCLTIIDPQGRILLQSKSDHDGKKVLKELQKLLSTSVKNQIQPR